MGDERRNLSAPRRAGMYIGMKDIAMRRRTFIQTIPLAAAGAAAALKSNAAGLGQSGTGKNGSSQSAPGEAGLEKTGELP